jgi:predicted DNA binding CopG/RHH family protein
MLFELNRNVYTLIKAISAAIQRKLENNMSNMNKTGKPTVADDAWDAGSLGRDEQYVRRASDETEAAVDETLAMQLISIRLPIKMIDDLKFIAKAHGIGYQPLVRDVLDRFIVDGVKEIVRETQARALRDANDTAAAIIKPRKAA